jgi:hypothetical protein
MDICKKKPPWNNLLAMYRMTLALFFYLRNIFMVLRKILEIGIPKCTTFLLPLDSLDDMDDCKPTPYPFYSGFNLVATCTSLEIDVTLYFQLVGSLLYLTHTRPDLSFVVFLVAQYMKTPHESYWKATKRILLYVCGTFQFKIHYISWEAPLFVGFTDSYWDVDPDDQKSTTGYVFILGSRLVT